MADNINPSEVSSRRNVEALIDAFKRETIKHAITPSRLGVLLEKILTMTDEEHAFLEKNIDRLTNDKLNSMNFGNIDISELDDIIQDIQKYITGQKPNRLLVFSGSAVVGILDIISDNMMHGVTEIFTSHYNLVNGKLGSSHVDSCVFTYARSFGLNSSNSNFGKWSDWQLLNSPHWVGTQDEYDAIESKDNYTLYFIKE